MRWGRPAKALATACLGNKLGLPHPWRHHRDARTTLALVSEGAGAGWSMDKQGAACRCSSLLVLLVLHNESDACATRGTPKLVKIPTHWQSCVQLLPRLQRRRPQIDLFPRSSRSDWLYSTENSQNHTNICSIHLSQQIIVNVRPLHRTC